MCTGPVLLESLGITCDSTGTITEEQEQRSLSGHVFSEDPASPPRDADWRRTRVHRVEDADTLTLYWPRWQCVGVWRQAKF